MRWLVLVSVSDIVGSGLEVRSLQNVGEVGGDGVVERTVRGESGDGGVDILEGGSRRNLKIS